MQTSKMGLVKWFCIHPHKRLVDVIKKIKNKEWTNDRHLCSSSSSSHTVLSPPLCRLHGRQAEQSHCSGPTKAGLPCVGGILVIGKGLQSRELWRSILWAEHGHCPQTVIEDMITRRFFLPRKWGGVFYEATLLLEDLYTVNRLLGSKRDFLQQVSSIIFSCFS